VTPTHSVADGMHSAIIRATKGADARPYVEPVSGRVAESGCCGGDGCC
jgi:hypothetical protein